MSARQHPACSPVAHAGYLVCDVCHAPGYATEAAWLDDTRILATYGPGCDHAETVTMMLSDAAFDQAGA